MPRYVFLALVDAPDLLSAWAGATLELQQHAPAVEDVSVIVQAEDRGLWVRYGEAQDAMLRPLAAMILETMGFPG